MVFLENDSYQLLKNSWHWRIWGENTEGRQKGVQPRPWVVMSSEIRYWALLSSTSNTHWLSPWLPVGRWIMHSGDHSKTHVKSYYTFGFVTHSFNPLNHKSLSRSINIYVVTYSVCVYSFSTNPLLLGKYVISYYGCFKHWNYDHISLQTFSDISLKSF